MSTWISEGSNYSAEAKPAGNYVVADYQLSKFLASWPILIEISRGDQTRINLLLFHGYLDLLDFLHSFGHDL